MAHHLRIRIGELEFEATGEADEVRADRDHWIAEFFKATRSPLQPKDHPSPPKDAPPEEAAPPAPGEIPAEWTKRVFAFDEGKTLVSLLLRPPAADSQVQDSIILLIYGYKKLAGLDPVPVTKITAGLRQSGFPLTRIDRKVPPIMDKIQKGGARKATKYSLNNVGMDHARTLLRAMNE